jgi:hypothetical protein
MHTHTFELHVGLRTSFGVLAWVPLNYVFGSWGQTWPRMWRCTECGEQGYEVAG